jgi:predicted nucleic acid-binding protein
MSKTVYIETTIPSSYYDERLEPEMVARRLWTRRWWDERRSLYSLSISTAVTDELREGKHSHKEEKLALVAGLPFLDINSDVLEIAEVYIARYVMPAGLSGDAMHLALATHYRIDVLLTWNCEHLANENKMTHIRRTNALMGLWTPDIITPLSLLGG